MNAVEINSKACGAVWEHRCSLSAREWYCAVAPDTVQAMFYLFFGSSIHMYCIIVTSHYPGILSWSLLFSSNHSVVTPSEKITLLLQQPGTKPHPAHPLYPAQSYRLVWCWYPQLPCSMTAIMKSCVDNSISRRSSPLFSSWILSTLPCAMFPELRWGLVWLTGIA